MALLLALALSAASAQTIDRQQAVEAFRNLSPAERAQAAKLLQQPGQSSAGTQQEPLEQPQVVRPVAGYQQSGAEGASETPPVPQEPMSALERRLNRGMTGATLEVTPTPRGFDEPLRQFGYDLFNGVPSTFAPATEIPVPADYVVGPGDVIEVQLFGKENAQHSLVVDRNGNLSFPGLGPIGVVGKRFDQISSDLRQRVSQQMIGVQASVSLGELRSVRIFVLGDVNRPGSYTVSSLSTITNALFVSGGVRPGGSLRNIELKRNGTVVARLDLYDLLLRGDTRGDARLQPGDVIFVPPIGATVGVAGEVRRPAIYELAGQTRTAEIVKLAGGLLPSAQPRSAQLERIDRAGGRTLIELDLTVQEDREMPVADGDVLRVDAVAAKHDQFVLLEGHVQRPGGYQWFKGMRLTDLLPSISQLLPKPDLDYVVIVREMPPAGFVEVRSARLAAALQAPDSGADPELSPRDRVLVFGLAEDRAELLMPLIETLRLQARRDRLEQVVTIGGNVPFPGAYPLEPGMRVTDLIRAAGGYSQSAYALEAELTRYPITDGKRRPVTQMLDLPRASEDEGANIELQPFDSLQIKQIQAWSERPTIRLLGEVRFPGEYTVHPGETLAEVLERAGGLTELGYANGAIFSREDLRAKEAEELRRLRERLQADLATVSLEQMQQEPGAQDSIAQAKGLVEQLETTKALGRLVIDMPALLAGTDSVDVHGGDVLFVPRRPQEVTVIGEVHQSTSHLFDPHKRRDDYVFLSGGLTPKADEASIYIVRANGAVIAGSRTRWFGRADQSIEPGDTIVVPLDVDRMRPLALWGTIADIASKLAITAASAKAVGVF